MFSEVLVTHRFIAGFFSFKASRANVRRNTVLQHTNTHISMHGSWVWQVRSCWDAFKVTSECSQRGGLLSDSIKVLWKCNKVNEATAGERMLQVIKDYTHTALSVPCCQREAAVFRDKKKKLHRSVYLNSNYTWSWDRDGSRGKDKQEIKLKEKKRPW